MQIDRYLRKSGEEFGQQRRNVQQPEGHGCCEPYQPARHYCLRQRGVLDCFTFGSTLLTAFETVALESFSSAAAAANERISATLAKIAKPSRSGSFDMSILETIDFDYFYFHFMRLSIVLRTKQGHSPEGLR